MWKRQSAVAKDLGLNEKWIYHFGGPREFNAASMNKKEDAMFPQKNIDYREEEGFACRCFIYQPITD